MQALTLQRYRDAVRLYIDFLNKHSFFPQEAAEHDDLLVERKNSDNLTKAQFETLIAAVEFAHPPFKGRLPWSKAVLAGWNVSHKAQHTVPMPEGPCFLVASHFASDGHARLAVGLLLQRRAGLRPSKMLQREAWDFSLPG